MLLAYKIDKAIQFAYQIATEDCVSYMGGRLGREREIIVNFYSYDEETRSKVPPMEVAAQYITENLEGLGIREERDFVVTPTPRNAKGHSNYISHYLISVFFPPKPLLGSPDVVKYCKELVKTDQWKEGIGCKRFRPAKSKKYFVGQRVLPGGVDHTTTKFKWYFLHSYRNGSLGAFRLYRSDGRLTTASLLAHGFHEDEGIEDSAEPAEKEEKLYSGVGFINTDEGGVFELEGDYFVRSFLCFGGPAFPISQLPKHLANLTITEARGAGIHRWIELNRKRYYSIEAVYKVLGKRGKK